MSCDELTRFSAIRDHRPVRGLLLRCAHALLFPLMLLQARSVWASAVLVQSATSSSGSTATNSLTVNLAAAPQPGDALVVWSGAANNATITSISGGGVTWVAGTTVPYNSGDNEIWYGLQSSGAGTSITLTYSQNDHLDAIVAEFWGLASSAALDVSSSVYTGNHSPAVLGSAKTTNANDLLLAIYSVGANGVTFGPTTPNTPIFWVDLSTQEGATGEGIAASYANVTTSNTDTGGYSRTLSPTETWGTGVIALKSASTASSSCGFVNAAQNTANNQTSVSATMTNNAGDFLVVLCREGSDTTSVSGASDTAGNTYTVVATTSVSTGCPGAREIGLYYAPDIKAAANNTISCNYASSSLIDETIMVGEFSGLGFWRAVDGSVSSYNAAPSSTSLTSGNLTTTYARDLLIFAVTNNATGATWTHGTGWTIPPNSSATNGRTAFQCKTVQSTGAYATVMSYGTPGCAAGILAAFKDLWSGGGQFFLPDE
jgi:hypothetical protein